MKFKCDICDGSGWVEHSFWKEYWKNHVGKDPVEVYHMLYGEYTTEGQLPPEEVECSICHGRGEFDDWFQKRFFEISKGKYQIYEPQARLLMNEVLKHLSKREL